MTDGIEVFQGVRVFGAAVDESDVLVDVVGGDANVCGSVRLVMAGTSQQSGAMRLLDRWRQHSTPLTLIDRGSTVALQDDLALFAERTRTTS